MPQPKIKEQASSKLLRAVEAIEAAEQALREVTVEDLLSEGYASTLTPSADAAGVLASPGKPLAANLIYDIHGYATALKLIRHSLFGSFLTGEDTLTADERALIEEGVHHLEANGAPGLFMRAGTKRMAEALERISKKLRL